MTFSIEFVNHASVLVSGSGIGLLSDPYFEGDAFHKGWSLLVETDDRSARDILSRTSHIWLSHEHPDHFSPLFFKKYGDILRTREISIFFQETDDKRVVDFLRSLNLNVVELKFNQPHRLSDDFQIVCMKDAFYDSALSMRVGSAHILNLNDCIVRSLARAREIKAIVGECDVLLTQFSYAAWKGGRNNTEWRKRAAREKLAYIDLQTRVFKPRVVLPFASFIRFSNRLNSYMNDAVNTPKDVVESFRNHSFHTVVMKPGDVFDGAIDDRKSQAAINFWAKEFKESGVRPLLQFDCKSHEDLNRAFDGYIDRVYRINNRTFMKIARAISPIKIFSPVVIYLQDIDRAYLVDIVKGVFEDSTAQPDLKMSSESLWFIFMNTFGFDTLTVNGCFEEVTEGGFSRVTKSMAIENLNNLGISFGPRIIFQAGVLMTFLRRLLAVSRQMRSSAPRD